MNWFLCSIIEHHTMKMYWGVQASFTTFDAGLDGCKLPASQLFRFTPEIMVSGSNWIGGWLDHSSGLDVVEWINVALTGN
jgi:hypothetical protein